MSDAVWLLLSVGIHQLFTLTLQVVPFRKQLRTSPRQTVLLGLLCSLFLMGLTCLAGPMQATYGTIRGVVTVLATAVAIGLYRLVLGLRLQQTLFFVFLLNNIHDAVSLAIRTINDLLTSMFLPYYTGYFVTSMIVAAGSLPLLLFLSARTLRPLVELNPRGAFWKYLWLMPMCFYLVFNLIVYPKSVISMEETDASLVLLSLLWSASVVLCCVIVMKMLYETIENMRLKEQLHLSELQLAMRDMKQESTQKAIEELSRTKHDQRHHMIVMQGLADKGDIDGIRTYLHNIWGRMELFDCASLCENDAADTVARYYAGMAARENVGFQAQLDIPADVPVSESDLCIILGNLLENAMEACQRQREGRRYIHVSAGPCGKMLALVVCNSFSGQVKEKNGIFQSSKREGSGVGIQSVRYLAESSRGMASFRCQNGEFRAEVLLGPVKA